MDLKVDLTPSIILECVLVQRKEVSQLYLMHFIDLGKKTSEERRAMIAQWAKEDEEKKIAPETNSNIPPFNNSKRPIEEEKPRSPNDRREFSQEKPPSSPKSNDNEKQ